MSQPLVERVLAGDRRALARAITEVENGGPEASAILDAVYPRIGRAHRIGVTGPPGAGKSTLVAALTREIRARGETVGIVAVDPTSSRTGGAILGDRVRMTGVALDPGVFIRSMATRGSLGGLARTTGEVCDVLDAAGSDLVIIETVGVGQSEVEVTKVADTVVIVLSPEAGDAIQTMKAGLLEVGHLFIVNKADRPGVERLVQALEQMLEMDPRWGGGPGAAAAAPGHHGVAATAAGAPPAAAAAGGAEPADPEAGWKPPVLKASADRGAGVAEVLAAIDRRRAWLAGEGAAARRRARVRERVRALVEDGLWRLVHPAGERAALDAWVERVERGEATPYQAARAMLAEVRPREGA